MIVVWITGLPSSGKSTLAVRLQQRLAGSILLDGDDVREATEQHGHDPAARDSFYRVLARLAALVARQGVIAIVAATSPSRAHRAFAHEVAPRLVEVFVNTPLAECARRDSKGLYAAARSGGVANLPGDGAAYEPPVSPDVTAHGGQDDGAVDRILALVRPDVPAEPDEVFPPPGISQVDPQPLTQVAAEAIDPEATEAAHTSVAQQRERLAVHGKNLP